MKKHKKISKKIINDTLSLIYKHLAIAFADVALFNLINYQIQYFFELL